MGIVYRDAGLVFLSAACVRPISASSMLVRVVFASEVLFLIACMAQFARLGQ